MIGVNEATAAEPTKTAEELYARMIGYYGRVVRVRSAEEIFDFSLGYGRASNFTDFRGIDRIGRLQGATLKFRRRGPRDSKIENSRLSASSVELSLQGSEPTLVDYLIATEVQVLQEDSGQWLVVHRGAEFFDPTQTETAEESA